MNTLHDRKVVARVQPASVSLATSPNSPGAARAFVRSYLARRGLDELAGTAALLLSELVTNAVMHGGDGIRVRLECDDGTFRAEVFDESPTMPEMSEFVANGELGGHGLKVVRHLAAGWGSEPCPAGKIVWFELGTRY